MLFGILFEKVLIFQYCKNKVCSQKGFKDNSCQSWKSEEKVRHTALAPLKSVGSDSSLPGVNHSQRLMAGNFAVLKSKDLKLSALKIINPFETLSKCQEDTSISRVNFALSKWPDFHKAYHTGFFCVKECLVSLMSKLNMVWSSALAFEFTDINVR